MMEPTELWTTAGILMGFQATSLAWRIQREAAVGDHREPTRLPPSDYLNLCALLVVGIGFFVLPQLNVLGTEGAHMVFGLGVVLWVGHAFALVGHYELYNPRTQRSMEYFPRQERIAVAIAVLAGIFYIVLAAAVSSAGT